MRSPVFGSRSISPPAGEGVYLLMPPTSIAAPFASASWQSSRQTKTGLLGVPESTDPYHTAADDDIRRPAARGERNAQQSHLNVSAHAVLSAEFGDAADGLQRSDGVGAGALPSASFSDGGRDGEGVADVEQHLEQELLALVGSVDIGHPRLVAGGLGAIVGFAVDRFEIAEDPLTGPWTHGGERYSLAT